MSTIIACLYDNGKMTFLVITAVTVTLKYRMVLELTKLLLVLQRYSG